MVLPIMGSAGTQADMLGTLMGQVNRRAERHGQGVSRVFSAENPWRCRCKHSYAPVRGRRMTQLLRYGNSSVLRGHQAGEIGKIAAKYRLSPFVVVEKKTFYLILVALESKLWPST